MLFNYKYNVLKLSLYLSQIAIVTAPKFFPTRFCLMIYIEIESCLYRNNSTHPKQHYKTKDTIQKVNTKSLNMCI